MKIDSYRTPSASLGSGGITNLLSKTFGSPKRGPKVGMSWDISEVIRSFEHTIPNATRMGIVVAFERASQRLLEISRRYVPIDTGHLYQTGRKINETELGHTRFSTNLVTSGSVQSSSYTVAVQYGEDNMRYPLFVHENTMALHGFAYNTAYSDKINAGVKKYSRKRDAETAQWLDVAMEEGEAEIKAVLQSYMSLAFRRLQKNWRRYGETSGSSGTLRNLAGSYKTMFGW